MRRAVLCKVVIVVLAGEAAIVAAIFGYERWSLWAKRNGVTYGSMDEPTWRYIEVAGIVEPPVLSAEAAALSDSEEVVGVEVAGKARAYRLGAFRDPRTHVVNDVVNHVPVSVTYCDLTDCTRVYTDPGGSTALDITMAGLRDDEMIVKIGGALYDHRSGKPLNTGQRGGAIPFELLPAARMRWKEWKERHPDTDVYVGNRIGANK